MATIGSLVVDLILKSAQFNADMAKSAKVVEANTSRMQRSVARIETGFDRARKALAGLGAGVAIASTVRMMTTLAKSAIAVGDEIGTAATKLGVGVEYLQRLRFAASLADVDIASLDAALKIFQKTVSSGKVPFTTFDALIAKIAEAKTHTEKIAIAAQYLGKQYQAALLIAADGAENFKKNMASANFITARSARIADEIDIAMQRIANSAQAGFNEGFLTAFNDGLKDSGDHLKDVNQAMNTLGQIMGATFVKVSNLLTKVAQFIADHPDLFRLALDPTLGIGFDSTSGDPRAGATGAGRGVRPATESFLNESRPPGGIVNRDAINKMIAEGDAEKSAAEAAAAKSLADEKTRAANAQKLLNEQQTLYKSLLEGSRTPQEQYRAALADITTAHADGELGARLQTMATANLASSYLDLAGQAVGALGTLFKDSKAVAVAQAVINTAQAITATLAQYGATPWGIAAAAVAAASGAAQIATIMSAQPGSSKKPKVGGGGGGGKKTKESSSGGEAGGSQRSMTVVLQGQGGFTRDQVRGLVDQINGLAGDGLMIRTG
jgi:hypothetical protein